MKALVTGSTGFVGSNLCQALTVKENFVVALMRDTSPSRWTRDCLAKCTIAIGDVRDFKLLKRIIIRYDIDTVFHLASQSIVRRAMKDPMNTYESNVMGTVNVLEACKNTFVGAILVTSTDKVYGEMPSTRHTALSPKTILPYKEYHALNALGIYESSKACMDLIGRSYAHTYGLPVVVSRACNIYGPGDTNPRIIPNTIRSCLRGQYPVIYKGVKYKREYVFIDDILYVYQDMVEKIEKTKGKVYNVGSGFRASQEEIVLGILEYFPNLKPKYVGPKEYMHKELTEQHLDSKRLWNDLRIKCEIDLDTGLGVTVGWWKSQWKN